MKASATFVDRQRPSGARLVLRGVADEKGLRLVLVETSADTKKKRSVTFPVSDVPALLAGLSEAARWWRNRGGERPPMEHG